jgi:hypothetical protein
MEDLSEERDIIIKLVIKIVYQIKLVIFVQVNGSRHDRDPLTVTGDISKLGATPIIQHIIKYSYKRAFLIYKL